MPLIKFESANLPKETKKKPIKTLIGVLSKLTGILKESSFVVLHEITDDTVIGPKEVGLTP